MKQYTAKKKTQINIKMSTLSPDWALLSIRLVTNTFIGSWVEFPDVTD
jgi:hypothetical protein